METTTKYTTRGNIRGCCGHKHRSLDAAIRCVLADQRDCERACGYSDRQAVRSDGEPIDPDDYAHRMHQLMYR